MSIINFSLDYKPGFDYKNSPSNRLRHNDVDGLYGFDAESRSVSAEETYIGEVVALGCDTCVRIMSDVWTDYRTATVWEVEENTYKTIRYQDVDACYNSLSIAHVDASNERLDHYAAWQEGTSAGLAYANAIGEYNRRQFEKIAEAKRPAKGKLVEVYKGRKVPKGTTGVVFWEGHSYGKDKVGIRTSDRRSAKGGWADVEWTAADNCRVIAS